jgi:uncharacterized protein YecT (DUF1311 family)
MLPKLLLAAVFILAPASFALADKCDQEGGTQAEMNYCAEHHFKQADFQLNDVYGRLKARYAAMDDAKAALTKSQRAWIGFRDAECAITTLAAGGGSAEPMLRLACLTRLTDERVKHLQGRLLCQEGELDCIAPGDAAD